LQEVSLRASQLVLALCADDVVFSFLTIDEVNLESDALQRLHDLLALILAHEAIIDMNGHNLRAKIQHAKRHSLSTEHWHSGACMLVVP
jgi:hypothetical protein